MVWLARFGEVGLNEVVQIYVFDFCFNMFKPNMDSK